MRMCCKCFIPTLLFKKTSLFNLLSSYPFPLLHLTSFTLCAFPSCTIRWQFLYFPFNFLSLFSEHVSCFSTGHLESVFFCHVMAKHLKQLLLCQLINDFTKASLGFCVGHPIDALDTNSWVLEHFCFSATPMLHYVLALYVASELPITIMFWSKRTWKNIIWSNNDLNNKSSSFQNMAFRKRHGSLKNRVQLKFPPKYPENDRNPRIGGIGRDF